MPGLATSRVLGRGAHRHPDEPGWLEREREFVVLGAYPALARDMSSPLIHRHDDLSTSMPPGETAERFGCLAQAMAAVDDRRHLP
jgi:hypothetical protein